MPNPTKERTVQGMSAPERNLGQWKTKAKQRPFESSFLFPILSEYPRNT